MREPHALRTLVADDEPLAIERLQILLADMKDIDLVGTASDGEQALRRVEALRPDLLLLDVSMPGLDGIAVARALEQGRPHPAVIYVSAFDHFAVSAFDVGAVDYLLKPVEPARLRQALDRVHNRGEPTAPAGPADASPWIQEFWVPHRSEVVRVAASDIERIEAERDYMRLHTGARSFLLHQTIGELERRLDPAHFIRIHRSVIVRRDCIAKLRHDGCGVWHADLADGKSFRIGRTYLANVKRLADRN